jgi:hypothetical protein
LKTFDWILVAGLAYVVARHFFPIDNAPAANTTPDSAITEMVNQINQSRGGMWDKETRFDGCAVGPEKAVTCELTLVTYKASEMDLQSFKQAANTMAISKYNADEMAPLREKQMQLHCRYKDKDNKFVFDAVVPLATTMQIH